MGNTETQPIPLAVNTQRPITQDTPAPTTGAVEAEKPICPREMLPFIQGAGMTFEEIGTMIGDHINANPDDEYPDRNDPTGRKKLINLVIPDPTTEILLNHPVKTVLPVEFQRLTVAQFIVAQFNHLRHLAKKLGYRAEFIWYRIPRPDGYADVRVYAYNQEGYLVGEYRGFKNTKVTKTFIRPARINSKNVEADNGGVTGIIQASGVPEQMVVTEPSTVITAAQPAGTLKPVEPAVKAT